MKFHEIAPDDLSAVTARDAAMVPLQEEELSSVKVALPQPPNASIGAAFF